MNEYLILSGVWVVIGAVWTYYSDRRAYNEGMMDAIVMHNNGNLTYETHTNDEGDEIIEMKVDRYED